MVNRRGHTETPRKDYKEKEESQLVKTPSKQHKYPEIKIAALREDVTSPRPGLKRQKILPVREKSGGNQQHTRAVVEISASRPTGQTRASKTTGSSVREIQDSAASDEESLSKYPAEIMAASKGSEIKSAGKASSPIFTMATKQKSRHIRLGSQEPGIEEKEVFSTASGVVKLDEESSDDDAPEAIPTKEALKSAKAKDREAAKATQEQEASLRKKRKERDMLLKQQAGSSSKKRKRGDDEDQDVTESALQGVEGANTTETRKSGANDENIGRDADVTVGTGKDAADLQKDRVDRTTILAKVPEGYGVVPELPLEYLEDDDEPEVKVSEPTRPTKKLKKSKLLRLGEKKPKDRRKGNVTYRVADPPRNPFLAPKASAQTRPAKEAWLMGRSGKNFDASRKPYTRSFFKSVK